MTRREWLEVSISGAVLAIVASWAALVRPGAPPETSCELPVNSPHPSPSVAPKSPSPPALDCTGSRITPDSPAVDCGMARINTPGFVDDLAERHKRATPTCRIPAEPDSCPTCGMAASPGRGGRFLDRKSQRG